MGKKIQCIGRYVMDGQALGKGTFAKVELATHSVTGLKVAIKIIDTRKIKEEYVQQNLHREARILGQLRHPNIVRLYETLKATTLYCLVLEYAAGGDLSAYIKTYKENCLPEDKGRVYMRQLISAVHYLHERGVAHRDLKMENIMLDEKKRNIKLVDFGLSNTFSRDEMMKTHCGSLEYAAPELFNTSEKYGPEVDVWALGVIMYAMLVGKLPFTTPYVDQYRRQKLLQQIEKGVTEIHEKEMAHLTKDCKNLLKKLLEPSCDLRLPLLDVEIHPWVTHGAKSPFYTFLKYPRDKTMKSQVIDELSTMLQMNKEQVETTVHENKCDDLSAMFNMMMDSKREQKGFFDIDYTVTQVKPSEKSQRSKNKKRSHMKSKDEKGSEATKVSVHVDDTQDDEHKKTHEHEHKVSTSFDFMAICSPPTWLGSDRRRSRRRRSHYPLPSPLAVNNPDASSEDVAGTAVGGDNPNQLSIRPGSVSSTPFNRRSLRSSRRRRRPSSCGPSSRRSLKEKLHHATGSSNSQPSSPTTLISPIITVDPPNHHFSTDQNVPGCYGSSTLKVPERTVSFSQMNDSNSEGQYSDSSNPCSAFSNLTPNSADSNSASAYRSKPDWACEGAYDTQSLAKQIVPEIQVPLRQNVPRFARQDTVEARIASADIKSIVRPKQLSAMQNQTLQNSVSNSLLPSCDILDDKKSGLHLPSLHNTDKIQSPDSQKLQISSSDAKQKDENCLLLPINVDRKDLLCDDRENLFNDDKEKLLSKDTRNLIIDGPSGDYLLDQATGGDSLDLANKTMQCEECRKNNDVFITDSSNEQTEESADELEKSIKKIHNSMEKVVLNNTDASNLKNLQRHLIGKLTSDENCDRNCMDVNSVNECILPMTVKSQHEEICIPYVVDLGVPYSHNNSPKYIETNIDAPIDQNVYIPPDSRKSSCSSLPQFIMPNTPTRQKFTSPIARIDSFHSEDFDTLGLEGDAKFKCQSNATTPASSVNTPTFPCFSYKLHLHKKKNAKLKSSQQKDDNQIYVNEERNVHDKCSRIDIEPTCSDPLLMGSGSEKSDDTDKPPHCSKAKIHPVDKDESFTKSKCTIDNDVICNDSQVLKQQTGKPCNSQPSEIKKTSVKCSNWKHGFVQFLKKKKQGQRHSSQNNNDSFRSNNHTLLTANLSNRNGHARCSYKPVPKSDNSTIEAETQFMSNSLAVRPDSLEIRPSPVPGLSPVPPATKMFDLTVLTESPQANSCLLSLTGCHDCTAGHHQSDDEGSECTFRFEQSVDVAIKTNMAIQNVQEAKTYTTYKCTHS